MKIEDRLEDAKRQFNEGFYIEALQTFHHLMEEAPPKDELLLSNIFYYIGNILLKLGYKKEAIGAWKSSLRITPNDILQKKLLEFINPYGMSDCQQSIHDDFKAFASIQIDHYLTAKKQSHFFSLAEADMVMDLISDNWHDFIDSGLLERVSCLKKIRLFQQYHIDFPVLAQNENIEIVFDFKNNRAMEYDAECNCGSGLPFYACCGSILDPKDYFIELK